jgi:3-dehydroquinate dehydratase II
MITLLVCFSMDFEARLPVFMVLGLTTALNPEKLEGRILSFCKRWPLLVPFFMGRTGQCAAISGKLADMTRSKRSQNTSSAAEPKARILALHGPNLNLLGTREPDIYGHTTLADIHRAMEDRARADAVLLESFQSNHEGQLIDRVQAAASEGVDFIIINPAAYTHTSVGLRDALCAVAIPYIEVHLSNIHAREPFRHHSYFSDRAVGVICGLGAQGYLAALEFALSKLR